MPYSWISTCPTWNGMGFRPFAGCTANRGFTHGLFGNMRWKLTRSIAVDYLLKLWLDDFKRAANKVKKQYDLEMQHLFHRWTPMMQLFFKTEHRWYASTSMTSATSKAWSEYLKIYIDNQKPLVVNCWSMKKLEERLPTPTFMRIHRSIVNLKKIQRWTRTGSSWMQTPSAHRRPVSRCVQRLSEHEILANKHGISPACRSAATRSAPWQWLQGHTGMWHSAGLLALASSPVLDDVSPLQKYCERQLNAEHHLRDK